MNDTRTEEISKTTQQPPTIERLDHWTLISSDIERSKKFYTEILGAVVPEQGLEYTPVHVLLAGTVIDFFPAGERVPSPGPAGPGGQHHAYYIPLDQYDRWIEYLEAKNVSFFKTTHGYGRISLYINDPDDYHIELTHIFDDLHEGKREIERRGMKPAFMPGHETIL